MNEMKVGALTKDKNTPMYVFKHDIPEIARLSGAKDNDKVVTSAAAAIRE